MSKANIKKKYSDIEAMFIDEVFSSSLFDNIKAKFKIKHKAIGKVIPYKKPKGTPKSRTVKKLKNRHKNTHLIIRSSHDGEYLIIDGSYVKWLTGQNVIGSENLIMISYKVFKKVCRRLKIKPTQQELEDVKAGQFELLRVDYTIHCDAGTEDKAAFFQQKIKENWVFSQPNYSHYKHFETLYINQGGDRWIFKSYLKGREISAKGSLDAVLYGDQIANISKRLIRFEVTFRSKWLKENNSPRLYLKYRNPKAWAQDEARTIMRDKIKELLSDVQGTYPSTKRLAMLRENHKLIVNSAMKDVPVEFILTRKSLTRYRDIIKKKTKIDILDKRQLQGIGVKLKNAQQLIDTRIKYYSDEDLFLKLCKAKPVSDDHQTSDIDDLIG